MSPGSRPRWSIGIYTGPDPLRMTPAPGVAQPVLTGADVTDVDACAVADPFLLRRDGRWQLFFEVVEARTGRGVIARAESDDGLAWSYRGVVLREEIHLSYPHVFEADGAVYMMPEARQGGSVRLYLADPFPDRWRLVGELLHGPYADPTPLRHDGRWWLLLQRGLDQLCLASSERLESGWALHPESPVSSGNRRRTRPGGRVIEHAGRRLCFLQDGVPRYGSRLRVFEIVALSETAWVERELAFETPIAASGHGWNGAGMHHLDAAPHPEGGWLGAVDGKALDRRRSDRG